MFPEKVGSDPMAEFRAWFDDAHRRAEVPNPNAFALATVDSDGQPSVRILLAKEIDVEAGEVVFFTNYKSRKGQALAGEPRAAASFHWDHWERQVRIEGVVRRCPDAESDAYFVTRPWLSRVGAWASEQSKPVESRQVLEASLKAAMRRFGIDPAHPPAMDASIEVPRPPHWGGYRLSVERIELWVGQMGRLHDRAVWARDGRQWKGTRLQP